MKILILANNDVGLFRFRKELIIKLLENNDVHISLPYGKFVDNLIELGCVFHNTNISRHGKNPIRDLKLFKFYKRLIEDLKPDVALTYTIKPNIYGGMACSSLKVPYIANITGLGNAIENPGLIQRIVLFLYKKGLKKSQMVFFQNKQNLDFMKRRGIIRGNFELLPGSGVNLIENKYEDYPADDKEVIFLTIGRILRDKGINELLCAARIIKKEYSNIVFKVIGALDEDYETVIDEAVKNGTIEYLGHRNDIHQLIKNSHATIHPSYHEGTSNVLLETAACGRPILASNVPGCNNTFDSDSGIAFEPKNVDSLAHAIRKFMSMPYDEKKRMGLYGRKKIEKEFDRSIVINKYIKMIDNIKRGEVIK